MYLQYYQLNQYPFFDSLDTHIFFPGGGRAQVLLHILEDIANGMALIHLGGDEGSGKSLLCQIIREKMLSTQRTVLLSDSLFPFDDMSQSLARALGEKSVKHQTWDQLYNKILRQISDQTDNVRPILVIIDDAEKLRPQDLERILCLAQDVRP